MADSPADRTYKTFVRLPAPDTLRLSGHFPWVHRATASASFQTFVRSSTLARSGHSMSEPRGGTAEAEKEIHAHS